jgi:hypothetical protein
VRATFFVIVSLALSAAPFTSGCYRPSVVEGGLFCGPGPSCPEGFRCIGDRCYRSGWDGSLPDTRPDGGSDRQPGDSGAEGGGVVKNRPLGESCVLGNRGTPDRTDDCMAGLVCVDSTKASQCFKRCSGTADCGGAACETRLIEAGGTVTAKVCALPPTACDPTMSLGHCPHNGICYLTTATETTCEITSGGGSREDPCTYSRDCLPGLTCATVGPKPRYCYPTCLTASPKCPAGQCQPTTETYSYCF